MYLSSYLIFGVGEHLLIFLANTGEVEHLDLNNPGELIHLFE